jgi:hypothetical protein
VALFYPSGFPMADQAVYATAAANNGFTVTLPAVAGYYHAISYIQIYRSATAALTGTASLTITSTNLPGSPSWVVGNLMVAGGTQIDVDMAFLVPIMSSVANTNTTLVLPTPGAAVLWNARVFYTLVAQV